MKENIIKMGYKISISGLFCVLFLGNITIGNGAPLENEKNTGDDLASDLENWMGNLPLSLKNVPINQLAIPGSHDSFTTNITENSMVSPDGEAILKALENIPLFKPIMASWSRTQELEVTDQLRAGIRFFDLRICKNESNKLHFCHSMYSSEVKPVLQQIEFFLDAHPKEFVILDLQHFYDCDSSDHENIISMLTSIFEKRMVPNHYDMNELTLDFLTNKNYQVLAIYRDSAQISQQLLWSTDSFPTPWYDTMDPNVLVSNLDAGLKLRDNKIGYVSQLILTPQVSMILENLLTNLKTKCAVEFEEKRTQWLSSQLVGIAGVNVVIADYINLSDNMFSTTVINLNAKALERITASRSIE